ncbi:MAG: TonB family protein [Bacteroidetes bacterium]|nr:TonB family protein [Bacteroidota bacterium]
MNEFWQYQFQSGITLTLLFGVYWFLLRKETFFKLHRFFLLAAGIISLVLPLINFSLLMGVKSFSPVQIVNNGYRYVETALVMNPVNITGEQQGGLTVYHFIWGVYLTGVFLLSGRLVYQVILIAKSIRQSETRILLNIPVNVNNRISAPFSFFGQIFIPFGVLKYKHFKEILIHEAEHLKQKHSWDLLFIELLCIFQWFNPIVWMVGRTVRETHEYLADQGVLRQGTIRTSYQAVLLEHTLGVPVFGLSHYFNNSISKKRMIMMKKRKSPNRRKWRMLFLIPVVVLLNLAFSNPFSGGSTIEVQKGLTETNLVKGKVTAEDTGKPLPGVNIVIIDANIGTITDKNGEFSLEVKEENIMLSVAFMGYETLVVKAKKDEFLNIVLKRITDKKELDYSEKKSFTQFNSIDAGLYIIDGKEVTKEEAAKLQQESENIKFISVLKGETAVEKYGEKGENGVIIITTKDYISDNSDGNLNSNENIKISSIYQDKTPLYFVNEKEITKKEFEQMNRENIQSITVLKEESAVNKYGERAINGVISITLKDYFSSNSNKKYFVKGKVLDDSTGELLPGASIVIMSTTIGTLSDPDGEFSLQLDKETVQVVFSFIGFETQIVDVKNGDKLEIRLKKTVTSLKLDSPTTNPDKISEQPDRPTERNTTGEIFFIVEDMPHFPGGKQALSEYISSNIQYPKKALKKNISGKVMVRFLVDKQGNVKDVAIEKGVDPLLDQEALRVVSNMPKWKPGEQRGKPVGVTLSVPVEFKLK